MQDTLPAAFQAVPMEVIYHLTSWVRSLPTLEERGGAALTVNYLIRMRSPEIAKTMAEVAEKQAKRGKHG